MNIPDEVPAEADMLNGDSTMGAYQVIAEWARKEALREASAAVRETVQACLYTGSPIRPSKVINAILALADWSDDDVPPCAICGKPSTYRLGMPTPSWCNAHGPKPGGYRG